MLQNNEMDALWMTEPQASMARLMKHQVVFDSRKTKIQPGVVAFREKEMRHPERAKQLQLFVKAYNQACDSINKNGFQRYRDLIMQHCNVKKEVVDSLPDVKKNPYIYSQGPRQEDVAQIEKWLGVKKADEDKAKGKKPKADSQQPKAKNEAFCGQHLNPYKQHDSVLLYNRCSLNLLWLCLSLQ